MTTFRHLAALALLLASTAALAQQTVLKIGVINPFTGPLALYGGEATRGYELAVDEANTQGRGTRPQGRAGTRRCVEPATGHRDHRAARQQGQGELADGVTREELHAQTGAPVR